MRLWSDELFYMAREGKDAYRRSGSLKEEMKRPFGDVVYYGEFDPGSERTLAARFKHASRTVAGLRFCESGERVSNT